MTSCKLADASIMHMSARQLIFSVTTPEASPIMFHTGDDRP